MNNPGLCEQVLAEIAAKGLAGEARLRFIEDKGQCGQTAVEITLAAELYIVPSGRTLEDMPKNRYGHIFPLAVARDIWVRCPIHGERILQKPGGHHITQK